MTDGVLDIETDSIRDIDRMGMICAERSRMTLYVCAAGPRNDEIDRVFDIEMQSKRDNGHPRSIRETRRAQKRGRKR